MDRPKVLFIGGAGRSGTTLVDRILGQIPAVFSAGELCHIWSRSFAEDQLCGCGTPFSQCPFWKRVMDEAFPNSEQVAVHRVLRLQRSVDRVRYIPLSLMPHLRTRQFTARLVGYLDLLNRLYKAIHRVSGSQVIVDSSKNPSHGFLLGLLPDVELYVLHLVRDSRAVAYSWQRRRQRTEIHRKTEFMPILNAYKSSLDWVMFNLLVYIMRYRRVNHLSVRYEDFAYDPRAAVMKILQFLGMGDTKVTHINGSEVEPDPITRYLAIPCDSSKV